MHARRRALVALLLLAVPLANAQTGTFSLKGVERDGDTLTLQVLNAHLDAKHVTASLLADRSLVALPERAFDVWHDGATKDLAFDLSEDVSEATLRLTWTDSAEASQTQEISFRVPEAADAPELVVVDATVFDNVTANFTVENVGGGSAGVVVASVEDATGVRVAVPFRQTLSDLAAGARANLSFTLGPRLREVVLVLDYDDRREENAVYLRNATASEASSGRIEAASDLPYREVEPGGTVTFPLRLTNEGRGRAVEVRAEGLPAGFSARLFVGGNGVPSVHVPASGTREASLSVTVPRAAALGDVPFAAVLVADGEEVGRVALSVTVRGEARIELRGDNWFLELRPGESRRLNVTLANTGSARAEDVEVEVSAPPGWRAEARPARLAVEPGAEDVVTLEVTAPEAGGSGRFVLEISAANEDVYARTRSLSVEVVASSSGGLLWIAAASVVGVVAVVVMVKVKRR